MGKACNLESIKQLLNCSIAELDPSTLTRLRAARMHAVSRHHAQSVSLFTWAGEHAGWHASAHRQNRHYWIGVILLVAGLFSSIVYWQHAKDNDICDVDIAILTDDLPIQYYAD